MENIHTLKMHGESLYYEYKKVAEITNYEDMNYIVDSIQDMISETDARDNLLGDGIREVTKACDNVNFLTLDQEIDGLEVIEDDIDDIIRTEFDSIEEIKESLKELKDKLTKYNDDVFESLQKVKDAHNLLDNAVYELNQI